jgi:hypothetical protein
MSEQVRFNSRDANEYFIGLNKGLNFIESYNEYSNDCTFNLYNNEGINSGTIVKFRNLPNRYNTENLPPNKYLFVYKNTFIADPSQEINVNSSDEPMIYSFDFIREYLQNSDVKLVSIQENGIGI